MRTWLALGAVSAAFVCALAVPVAMAQQKDEKSSQDRVKSERELRDLESQRDKLDTRIRELRRGLGRDREIRIERNVVPKVEIRELKGLSEDQRREVERAMEEARKSVHEALKNLPNEIHIPDVSGIVDKSLRLYIDKDGKVIRSEGKMSDEEREKLRKSLEKMREKLKDNNANLRIHMEELHKNLPNIRAFGLGESGNNGELRKEMEELRREIRELRDEVKKKKGGESANPAVEVFN